MNPGPQTPFYRQFDVDLDGNESIREFNELNKKYLKWLLPKP